MKPRNTSYNRAVSAWINQLPLVPEHETKALHWPAVPFTPVAFASIERLAAARGWKWILHSHERCHFQWVPFEVGPKSLRAKLKADKVAMGRLAMMEAMT